MYNRFFPDAPESDSVKFSQGLPEWKISMAKLQGHFLKHRMSARDCLNKVGDIMKEGDVITEMPVSEWLDRMNLLKYMPMFSKVRAHTVREVREHVDDSGGFDSCFNFTDLHDQMRLSMMSRGEPSAREDFEYQT